jgi:hypothetical protein
MDGQKTIAHVSQVKNGERSLRTENLWLLNICYTRIIRSRKLMQDRQYNANGQKTKTYNQIILDLAKTYNQIILDKTWQRLTTR